jgi:hypothetical protein
MPRKVSTRFTERFGKRTTLGLAIACFSTAALILTARQLSPADATTLEVRHLSQPAWDGPVVAAEEPASVPAARSQAKPQAAAAANVRTANALVSPTPEATVARVSTADSGREAKSGVTLSGCLVRDGNNYHLKDTVGDNAPRSRSWKSGFLKKSNASVDVIDASNRLALPKHVGQRVSVTGTLVQRDIQAQSLQRLSESCKDG